jgi:hypothetical protein
LRPAAWERGEIGVRWNGNGTSRAQNASVPKVLTTEQMKIPYLCILC